MTTGCNERGSIATDPMASDRQQELIAHNADADVLTKVMQLTLQKDKAQCLPIMK